MNIPKCFQYFISRKSFPFDNPNSLFSPAESIIVYSFCLTLRNAIIYVALQVLPIECSVDTKEQLGKSLQTIVEKSENIQKLLKSVNDENLAESVYNSIVILRAVEQNISIEEADRQQRKRWE